MKTTNRSLIGIAFLAAALAALPGGCGMEPKAGNRRGNVLLSFVGVSRQAARTLLPAAPDAGDLTCDLTFTSNGYDTVTVNNWTSGNITLAAAEWSLDVTAKLAGLTVGTASALSVVISEGETVTVPVTLAPVTGTGTGNFQYSVTLPEEVSAATLKLASYPAPDGTSDPAQVDLLGVTDADGSAPGIQGTIEGIAAGYYTLTVTITKGETAAAVCLAHIYGGLTTGYSEAFDDTLLTNAPDAPEILEVSAGSNTLTVKWDAVSGAASYSVWYSTGEDPSQATLWEDGISGCEKQISGLVGNTAYNLWVKAANASGESPWSTRYSGETLLTPLMIVWHTSKEAFDANADPNKFDYVWSVKDAYEAQYGGPGSVTVTAVNAWDDQRSTLRTKVNNNEPVDLAWMTKYFIMEYLNFDLIQDLSPYLNPAACGLYAGLSLSYTFDNKIYAAGVKIDPYMLYFNWDLFNEAALKTPRQYYDEGNWTWETFAALAQELSSGSQWGYGCSDTEWTVFMAMNGVRSYFPNNITPGVNYDVISDFFDDKAKAALSFLREGYTASPAYFYAGDYDYLAQFKAGNIAMSFAKGFEGFSTLRENEADFALEFVPLPAGPDCGSISGLGDDPEGFCIPKTSENPEGAAVFMRMAAQKYLEHQNEILPGANDAMIRAAASKSVFSPLEPFYGIASDNFWDANWKLRQYVRDPGSTEGTMVLDTLVNAANGNIVAGNPLPF
ncbi:MAG: fibronectin type III domain-containing protein [Treponema sp.]|jgi:hypothetical protein|nr:fibronectin type III domain-containing protein [Treponema sp.]